MSTGEFIRRRRLEMGLTQQQLAERAGMYQRRLSQIERGAGPSPKLPLLRRLAAALEVSVLFLVEPDEGVEAGAGRDDLI